MFETGFVSMKSWWRARTVPVENNDLMIFVIPSSYSLPSFGMVQSIEDVLVVTESRFPLESQSQIHSQKRRMCESSATAYGGFECVFGFHSQEWLCSRVSWLVHLAAFMSLSPVDIAGCRVWYVGWDGMRITRPSGDDVAHQISIQQPGRRAFRLGDARLN